MKSKSEFGRRQFLTVSGGVVAAAATGQMAFAIPEPELSGVAADLVPPRHFTLDLGYRAPRSGPITALKNGHLL